MKNQLSLENIIDMFLYHIYQPLHWAGYDTRSFF